MLNMTACDVKPSWRMEAATAILLISSLLVPKKSPACWPEVKTARWSAPHLHFDKITFFPAFALPQLIVQPWPVEMEPRNHASGSAMCEREQQRGITTEGEDITLLQRNRLTLHISRKSSSAQSTVYSSHRPWAGDSKTMFLSPACSLPLHSNAWENTSHRIATFFEVNIRHGTRKPKFTQYSFIRSYIHSYIH